MERSAPPASLERNRRIEMTIVAPPPRSAAPARALVATREQTVRRAGPTGLSTRPASPALEPALPPAPAPGPRRPINLFASDALARAVSATPADPGGHLRRATNPTPPSDERERVAARVHEMIGDAVGRERASSGHVAPRWREIERKLAQSFHPPLALVKQENVVKAFAHQVLRSWLDGEPHVGPVARGVDASVQTLPGTPEGLNLRSLPEEQALAMQAGWGRPASWLRVEVEVTLDEQGRILSAVVTRPSGRRRFNRSALAAVAEAIRAGGAPEEHRTVVTRWLVEAAVAVAPPTAIGFRFDETGHLDPGASGWRKYVGGTYPLQQSVQTHVSLVALLPGAE